MTRVLIIIRNILAQNSPSGWVVIALGLFVYKFTLTVSRVAAAKSVNNITWPEYLTLREFTRTTPNLVREFEFLSPRSILLFKSITGIQILRRLFISRRKLAQNRIFVSLIEEIENSWWEQADNPFLASKLIHALHYILLGTDSPPSILRNGRAIISFSLKNSLLLLNCHSNYAAFFLLFAGASNLPFVLVGGVGGVNPCRTASPSAKAFNRPCRSL